MTEHSIGTSQLTAAAALALLLTSGLAQAGGALPTYHVTDLGPMIEEIFPNVEYPSSDAFALNENGDLVGESNTSVPGHFRGWIYTVEHGVVPLPVLPGDTRAMVRDVSERDANGEVIIVGASTYVVERWMAVLWRFSTVTGEVLEMREIGIPPGFDETTPVAVNNDGIVVGSTYAIGPYTNWKYDVATDVLEAFDFPWRVADLNNVGQVCGGSYRGDLFGNYEDLTDTYEPGDVMPQWAIDNGGISAGWHQINDQGWLVGRAGTGISDGAGHYLVAVVRFADPIGWTSLDVVSYLDSPGGINDPGDFINVFGVAYFEDMGQQYYLSEFLAPEFPDAEVYRSYDINNNRQVAGNQAHAFLLTPLGEMIIPGDVNGDVSVDLDDHCAWLANPIDLDGDGDADAADEVWLIARLAVFGYSIQDCNGNGVNDRCDIMDALSNDCDLDGVPDECQPDCNGDGVPDVCEDDCNGNGNPDPCDIADGASEDCNGNGIPDECDGGGVVEQAVAYDPPVVLLQGNTVTHDMLFLGAGTIEDVDFTIDIAYRIGFLSVLLSHNGTTITLIDRPGVPEEGTLGNGQFGYAPGILDDEGTGGPIEDEGNFGSPFEPIVSPPSYTPNEALSAFDEMPMEGVWTIHVITNADYSSPAHELYGWGLTITRAGVDVPPCDPADIDGDGVVGFQDLIALLAAWGPNPGHPADINGDGVVDFADLLALLSAWSA